MKVMPAAIISALKMLTMIFYPKHNVKNISKRIRKHLTLFKIAEIENIKYSFRRKRRVTKKEEILIFLNK